MQHLLTDKKFIMGRLCLSDLKKYMFGNYEGIRHCVYLTISIFPPVERRCVVKKIYVKRSAHATLSPYRPPAALEKNVDMIFG
jgi:hypothetical protein